MRRGRRLFCCRGKCTQNIPFVQQNFHIGTINNPLFAYPTAYHHRPSIQSSSFGRLVSSFWSSSSKTAGFPFSFMLAVWLEPLLNQFQWCESIFTVQTSQQSVERIAVNSRSKSHCHVNESNHKTWAAALQSLPGHAT